MKQTRNNSYGISDTHNANALWSTQSPGTLLMKLEQCFNTDLHISANNNIYSDSFSRLHIKSPQGYYIVHTIMSVS